MNAQIEFKNVSKSYVISRLKYKRLSEDFSQIFQRFLLRKKRTIQKEALSALKNISFVINRGDCVGIIGKNGAGKSTILKLISHITYPDSGEINVNGRIGAFIELGAGLHPELSGRENIYLYGVILGMSRKEIDEKFLQIVKFSELEKFLDTPIKYYSTGMYSRLGFSVVAFMNPDILLIDEVLAVGDRNFQERCLLKMEEFKRNKKTIVFVSHNLNAIEKLCSGAILLKKGRIISKGETRKVINLYVDKYADKSLE